MADENGILWEDPPDSGSGTGSTVWRDRLAPLEERPGEWARVKTFPTANAAQTTAYALRSGRIAAKTVDASKFEFTCRALPDGTGAMWARYIGNGS